MSTVAIDFGTSNTVICIRNPITKKPETLTFAFCESHLDGPTLVPSLLYLSKDKEEVLVGKHARGRPDKTRLFRGFKRDLSQEFIPSPRLIDGKEYTSTQIGTLFLHQILETLRAQKVSISQLVLTAPVGAYEKYLTWLRETAIGMGIANCIVVDESNAAAMGYAITKPGAIVMVIDLGGGTLDISLVRVNRPQRGQTVHRAEVLAKSDRPWGCGGQDIDQWIVEAYLQKEGLTRKQISEADWQNLLSIAEQIKMRLSSHDKAEQSWFNEETFETHELHLTQKGLEEILEEKEFFERMREAIDEVLEQAYRKGCQKSDIESVILVGGTSLIPAVQQQTRSIFGRNKVKVDKPFEAVAHGALEVVSSIEIVDILRHTYALRHWNPYAKRYEYLPVIQSGTQYPMQCEPIILQANADGQKEVVITIGEGSTEATSEVVYDENGLLQVRSSSMDSSFHVLGNQGSLKLPLDPPGRIGFDRLEVCFEVSAARQLLVSVKDLQLERALLIQHLVGRAE